MWLSKSKGKNPNKVWWNDVVRAAVELNEDAGKQVLGAKDEVTKERCIEVYK